MWNLLNVSVFLQLPSHLKRCSEYFFFFFFPRLPWRRLSSTDAKSILFWSRSEVVCSLYWGSWLAVFAVRKRKIFEIQGCWDNALQRRLTPTWYWLHFITCTHTGCQPRGLSLNCNSGFYPLMLQGFESCYNAFGFAWRWFTP